MPALTVAYLGNFTRPWCTEVHVARSLGALGHRVIELQEDRTDLAMVPRQLTAEHADLFLWTRTWPTPMRQGLAMLHGLREAGIPSVFFHLDRWFGLGREHQVADEPCFRCDLVVTADGGHDDDWLDAGVNHLWLPPAVFHAETRIGRRHRAVPPVVFVGSHPYPHPEWVHYRSRVIDTLADRYGPRFRVYPRDGRPVRGQALADLYASATVVVGDSCLAGGATRYWSDRIPETVGRGALLIHPEVEGLDGWYRDGEHLATYPLGDFDALVRQVDTYLADADRRRHVAEAGQLLVEQRDTYVHRMDTVIDRVVAAHA